jgi:hypothetical protein
VEQVVLNRHAGFQNQPGVPKGQNSSHKTVAIDTKKRKKPLAMLQRGALKLVKFLRLFSAFFYVGQLALNHHGLIDRWKIHN